MIHSLAIETSARIGSVALALDGRVVSESRFEHGLRHAAELVVRIDQLVREAGWTPQQLDRVDVSVGPGSFTGLRIGVTLAKTLSFSMGVPLCAVPSALALAYNAPADARCVRTVLDAKRGQVFTALLRRNDEWTIEEPPKLSDLAAAIAGSPRPLLLIGEGLAVHPVANAEGGVSVAPEEDWVARAASVARIGHQMASASSFADPDTLVPLYIRIPEAEEKYLSRQAAAPADTP